MASQELQAGADEITEILKTSRVVAVVGLSSNPDRPSHQVARYLQEHGYRIIPVNPGCREVLGETCYASLGDVPFPLDLVDIFRNVEAIPAIVDEAITVGAKVVWMQLGVRNDEAAKLAEAAGLKVVMNRCPKIEYGRLSGELSWAGVNSRMLSSKRALLAAKGVQHRVLKATGE